MAINVDAVYKTVLLILNQQQRGYMTPDEFNKVATQVQLNIFEKYEDDLNQQYRVPQNDTEYANRVKNIEDNLQFFQNTGTAIPISSGSNFYSLPSTSLTISNTQSFTQAGSVNTTFSVTSWTSAASQAAYIQVYKQDLGAGGFILQTSPTQYTWDSVTNIVTFVTAPTATDVIKVDLMAADVYRLGSVFYQNSEISQYSQRNELRQILLSPLTQPTTSFPVYLYEKNIIEVYPTTITATGEGTSNITVSYLKIPANVVWGYGIGTLGQFEYNASLSTNFELNISEQTNTIIRILAYSGVIINDPTIIQVAQQEIQSEEQNSKM